MPRALPCDRSPPWHPRRVPHPPMKRGATSRHRDPLGSGVCHDLSRSGSTCAAPYFHRCRRPTFTGSVWPPRPPVHASYRPNGGTRRAAVCPSSPVSPCEWHRCSHEHRRRAVLPCTWPWPAGSVPGSRHQHLCHPSHLFICGSGIAMSILRNLWARIRITSLTNDKPMLY